MDDRFAYDISLGSDVVGRDGDKLGEVSRFIANAGIDQITEIVVKHGRLLHTERIVPLSHVTRVEDGAVHLDLDSEQLDRENGFTTVRRASDPDYIGPPPADQDGTHRGNLQFDVVMAQAAGGGLGPESKPLGFPGGERVEPDAMQRSVIDGSTDVLAADGERIGSVGHFAVTPGNGRPVHLTLQQGTLFKHEAELPLAWISSLGTNGVLLRVGRSEVESLLSAAS